MDVLSDVVCYLSFQRDVVAMWRHQIALGVV